MRRSARSRVQLEAVLASVRTLVPDLQVEIGGRGMGAYLRLAGDAPEPTLAAKLQGLTDQLREARAGDASPVLDVGTLLPSDSAVQLGFYPWVPLLPGGLRSRLTAQAAVKRVLAFLDQRLGADGWPGGGSDVRTRVHGDRIDVTLIKKTTGATVSLPPLPRAPFRRDRRL